MENASKALIIAGAILVAIMIVSLGVFIFNRFGGAAKQAANMDEQEINAFNSKITPYLGEAIAGSQVNALLQYCLSVNMAAKNSEETYKYITVSYIAYDGSSSILINKDSTSYTRVITGGKYYKVEETYDNNGLITQIKITQK